MKQLYIYILVKILDAHSMHVPEAHTPPPEAGTISMNNTLSTCPFRENLVGHIPDQDVHMLQARHTLQRRPILEPLHLLPRARQSLEPAHKPSLHEVVDLPPRRRGHVAPARLRLQSVLQPDHDVHDARLHAVGPVIRQDLEVALVLEGDGADEVEPRAGLGGGGGERSPSQPLEHDVVGDGAVAGFDRAGPFEVAAEIGGFALEEVEVVICWWAIWQSCVNLDVFAP
jgi:hypothetical protein